MPNPLDSEEKAHLHGESQPASRWLKVAGVAAVSALAGGLAAAWWHRKTLAKLHQGQESSQNPDFRISGTDGDDGD